MPEILMLNSCVYRDRVNNVGFVPQIRGTDGMGASSGCGVREAYVFSLAMEIDGSTPV